MICPVKKAAAAPVRVRAADRQQLQIHGENQNQQERQEKGRHAAGDYAHFADDPVQEAVLPQRAEEPQQNGKAKGQHVGDAAQNQGIDPHFSDNLCHRLLVLVRQPQISVKEMRCPSCVLHRHRIV